MEDSDRLYQQLLVEEGTTGQDGSVVAGATEENDFASKALVEDLRTGKDYSTPGEAELGTDLVDGGESLGSLPALTTVAPYLLGAGAFYAGVEIGDGLDQFFGIETLREFIFGAGPDLSSEHFWFYEYAWTGGVRIVEGQAFSGATFECARGPATGPGEYTDIGIRPSGICLNVAASADKLTYCISSRCTEPGELREEQELWFGSLQEDPLGGVEITPPIGVYAQPVGERLSAGEKGFYMYLPLMQGCVEPVDYEVCELAFPQGPSIEPGLQSEKGATEVQKPLTPPLTVPPPGEVPASVRHWIIERAKEKDGKKVVTPLEPGPAEIPSPLWPVVPAYSPNELGTDYATEVEKAGFLSTEIKAVPESDIDSDVGPGDVVSVSPSVGTSADPATTVKIAVNPADSPPPVVESHIPVPDVTPPGIKFPKVSVLCHVFPFGVPCWIEEEFVAWSTTSSVPTLSTSSFEIHGQKIAAAHVTLSPLEPLMEILRPMLVVFSTIGLVILFYKFATGSSAGDSGDE